MTPARSQGPFDTMVLNVVVATSSGRMGRKTPNRVSGKMGDMSLFTAIEW
jgi:hypothetical protein